MNVPECKILIDTFDKWWKSDEYRDLSKQTSLISKNNFLKNYEYFDDYDEEMYYY